MTNGVRLVLSCITIQIDVPFARQLNLENPLQVSFSFCILIPGFWILNYYSSTMVAGIEYKRCSWAA
jgi:hypothetical protein